MRPGFEWQLQLERLALYRRIQSLAAEFVATKIAIMLLLLKWIRVAQGVPTSEPMTSSQNGSAANATLLTPVMR